MKGRPRLEAQWGQQVHISHLLLTRALVQRTNSRISMVISSHSAFRLNSWMLQASMMGADLTEGDK